MKPLLQRRIVTFRHLMATKRLKTLALGGSINLHKDARPEFSGGAERLDHDPTWILIYAYCSLPSIGRTVLVSS